MTTLEHELEIALRAEAPRPSDEFARKMNGRVAAGFPRPSRRVALPRGSLLPAIAAGTALIVAILIVVSVTGGGSQPGGSSSGASVAESGAATSKAAPGVASAQ